MVYGFNHLLSIVYYDTAKFSELVQNRGRRERLIDKPVNNIGHAELGFYLLHEIWHDNLLNLDQNVDKCDLFNILKPWFQSSTWQHHGKPPQNDLNISRFNLDIHFIEENKVDARIFVKQTVELLLDIKLKTFLHLKQNAFKDTSNMVSQLTKWSDHIGSNDEFFRYCLKSMSIKDYWRKYAIQRAESALEAAVNISEFLEEDEDIDLILIRKGKSLIECLNNDLGADGAKILNEAVKCFEEAAIINPECRGKELAEKYKHRLERENKDRSSEPAKKITSDNPTNKDKISKDHIDVKFDRRLFEILRSLRKEHANGKPPFTIFPDKSLKDMATYFPQDLESFNKISGIGKKYEIYGESFLEKIVTYCKIQETNTEHCYPTKLKEILNLCKQNLTLEEIAQKTNLEENDIIVYIEELILCGAEIPFDNFVNGTKQEKIKEAISKAGDKSISDIRRKLNDCFTDADIRFVRAYKIRNDK